MSMSELSDSSQKGARTGNEDRVAYLLDMPRDKEGKVLPGRTKQSHKDECDINYIMRKFEKTGQLPDMIKSNPSYGDFSNVPDYQAALGMVEHAKEQFNALSAKVRARFNNDPSQFLAFATDPRNGAEMVKLGLAKARPKAKPVEAAASESSASAPKVAKTKKEPKDA